MLEAARSLSVDDWRPYLPVERDGNRHSNNGAFTSAEIDLFDRLQDRLSRIQPALVVRKPDRWMLGDFGQLRPPNDQKIFRLDT